MKRGMIGFKMILLFCEHFRVISIFIINIVFATYVYLFTYIYVLNFLHFNNDLVYGHRIILFYIFM